MPRGENGFNQRAHDLGAAVIQERIRARRELVAELKARGYTQRQIASRCGVGRSAIASDIKALAAQAEARS